MLTQDKAERFLQQADEAIDHRIATAQDEDLNDEADGYIGFGEQLEAEREKWRLANKGRSQIERLRAAQTLLRREARDAPSPVDDDLLYIANQIEDEL